MSTQVAHEAPVVLVDMATLGILGNALARDNNLAEAEAHRKLAEAMHVGRAPAGVEIRLDHCPSALLGAVAFEPRRGLPAHVVVKNMACMTIINVY